MYNEHKAWFGVQRKVVWNYEEGGLEFRGRLFRDVLRKNELQTKEVYSRSLSFSIAEHLI